MGTIEHKTIKRNKAVGFLQITRKKRKQKKKSKMISRKICFRLLLKCLPKSLRLFQERLLNRMGVEFTEKGVQISNDGGIDGYGYHTDANDFRTTRVVIQCKRYNASPVTEPEINQFLGAMNK